MDISTHGVHANVTNFNEKYCVNSSLLHNTWRIAIGAQKQFTT